MSQSTESGHKSFNAIEAIPKNSIVSLAATGVQVCAINEVPIGTATRAALAANDFIDVKLFNAAGSHKMIASAALAIGALAYTAADGEVGASASTAYLVGVVLEAATADQDVIEVAVMAPGTAVA